MFLESFIYFDVKSLPTRYESNFHVYDNTTREINCELHGFTISYHSRSRMSKPLPTPLQLLHRLLRRPTL